MKTLLLHAPGDSPCDSPWLGVPALVAHLKKVGYPETHQRDLDLDLYYHAIEPETLRRLARLVRSERGAMAPTAGAAKRLFVRWLGLPVLKLMARWELRDLGFFERFRTSTPVEQQFPEKGVIRYRKTLNRILKLMGIFYYPYLAYPKFFSKREEDLFYRIHLRLGCAFSETLGLGRKALEDFYQTKLVPQLQAEDYDFIGISVSVQRQFEPAQVCADVIRRNGLRAKVVVGGSYISDTYDAGWFEDAVVRRFDYAIRYEGEEALPMLMAALRDGTDVREVPNLVYFDGDERVETQRTFLKNMDDLDAPDYDGLPLERYLDRPLRLPVMSNRGCYWGRCSFCSHHFTLGTGRMRARSPERVVDDMQVLQEKYGARSFFFSDESMHPGDMKTMCEIILERGLKVSWSGMMRFEDCMDPEYLELFKKAGCYTIMFGLESIAQNVQDIIQKGVNTELVWRVLEDCKRVGLKVHLFIILGTPGETEEDMKENIDFLLNNTHLYDTVQIATFELTANSPMHVKPRKWGIYNIQTISGHASMAYSENAFEVDRGLDREAVEKYFAELIRNKTIMAKDMWGGYGFRIYQPDPADHVYVKPPRKPDGRPGRPKSAELLEKAS